MYLSNNCYSFFIDPLPLLSGFVYLLPRLSESTLPAHPLVYPEENNSYRREMYFSGKRNRFLYGAKSVLFPNEIFSLHVKA